MKLFYIGCVIIVLALLVFFFSLFVSGPYYYYIVASIIGVIGYFTIKDADYDN